MTNKIGRLALLLTITIAFALLFAPSAVSSPALVVEANGGHTEATSTKPATGGSRETRLNPALVGICTCESGQGTGKPQQYDIRTGEVLHGKINHNDIGMCQINTQPENGHLVASKKMGLDIYTESGNIAYANWLYEQQGDAPWGWSKSCWGATNK